MYKVIFESCCGWYGYDVLFEGTLEECLAKAPQLADENISDSYEEEVYIEDENGNRVEEF